MQPGGWSRRLPVTIVVTIALFLTAACSHSAHEASTAGAPGESAVPSAANVPGAGCTIQQPPGPGDAPPAGGETDTKDQGAGRWRVCLTTPAPTTVEGSAWCTWNADRTAVDDVSGLPTTSASVAYDTFLSFARSELEVHLTDQGHGGLIANYVPRQQASLTTDSTHRSGTAVFDVALQVDPESGPPPGAPPTVTGIMAWVCGDPPAAG